MLASAILVNMGRPPKLEDTEVLDRATALFWRDGCDAVFLGYPTVSQRARLVQWLSRVPAPIASAGHTLLSTPTADRRLGHVAGLLDDAGQPEPRLAGLRRDGHHGEQGKHTRRNPGHH